MEVWPTSDPIIEEGFNVKWNDYKYSEKSLGHLSKSHKDLQLIFEEYLRIGTIDIRIVECSRSLELQQKYYREGKSQIDGVNKKGKHNYNPSHAIDIVNLSGDAYNKNDLSYIAGQLYNHISNAMGERIDRSCN